MQYDVMIWYMWYDRVYVLVYDMIEMIDMIDMVSQDMK